MYKRSMTQKKWSMKAASVILSLGLIWSSVPIAQAAEKQGKIDEVYQLLEQYHVSAPSRALLEDGAVRGMIEALGDPYTTYFTKQELDEFTNSVENVFVGVGILIGTDPKGIYIEEVFDGSPAQNSGVQVGDIITGVGGDSIIGLQPTEVSAKILGEENTQVRLTVLRGTETKEFMVTRKQVKAPVIRSRLYPGGVGYIELTVFSSDAGELVRKELKKMKEQGLNGLVLDVRNNPGGLLESAKKLASLFIEEGVLIQVRDRDGITNKIEFSGGEKQPFPVYLLVDQYSASASEVLMGALQDYGVAKAVGEKTFGKGSVQQVIDLENGGALKLTIEEYLTPKLREVNKVGLEPDVVVKGTAAQLIEALRLAGMQSFNLTLRGNTMLLEGQYMSDYFDIVRQDGKLYVPSRVLAALANAKVSWNENKHAVELVSKDGQISYIPQGAEVVMKNDTAYVDIAAFNAKFSGLTWKDDGYVLTIQAASK